MIDFRWGNTLDGLSIAKESQAADYEWIRGSVLAPFNYKLTGLIRKLASALE